MKKETLEQIKKELQEECQYDPNEPIDYIRSVVEDQECECKITNSDIVICPWCQIKAALQAIDRKEGD